MNNAVYKNIISRFKSVTLRYFIIGIADAFVCAFLVFVCLIGVSALCESVLYMTPSVKTVLFFSSLFIPAIVFVSLVSLCIARRPGHDEISRMIERRYPHLNDRLISAVQLGRLDEDGLKGQSKELIYALIKRVDEETEPLDIARSIPVNRLFFSLKIASGAVFIFLLIAILFPDYMMGGFYRLADHSRYYISPGKTNIYIINHKDSILRGEDFDASGFFAGNKSENLSVFYRWNDSRIWNMKSVSINEKTGNFAIKIEKPRTSFQYYLETNDAITSQYDVTVIERPDIEALEITLNYPEHAGLNTISRKDNDGNIRALKGTDVLLIVRANKILKNMSILWSDSTITNCKVNGNTGTISFRISKSVDYYIGLIDTLGISNINPINYRITSIQDETPVVSILSPVSDITLPGSMTFPLIYSAMDDYGISSAELKFKLPYEEDFRYISLQNGKLDKNFVDEYLWNMSDLNLLPDDVIPFNLIVYDNDTINGPKQGISETRSIRLPSMTDIFTDIMEEQNTGIDKLRELSKRASEQGEKLNDINRNILNSKELEWSDKNLLEESKKNLGNMQKEIKDVSEVIKNITEKLSDEDMAALETLEKLQKISEIMDDIAEGEMKEALRTLTEANLEVNPHKIKQFLDHYKITVEDIKKKLDNIINVLEQVKSIQRYEMAKRLLEDIALKQAEITAKYRQDPDNQALHREEEKLSMEMEKIQNELKGVSEDLKDKFKLNTMKLEKSIESHNVAEKKKQASQQMTDGLTERAKNSLDESNTMISELLAQMDAIGAMMQAANSEEMKRRLFKSMNEMLVVSNKQEQLLSEIEKLGNEELAKREINIIDALSKAEKSLSSFGEVFIESSGIIDMMITSTRMTMENTVDIFSKGQIKAGEKNAQESLKQLNNNIYFLTMLIQKSGSNYGSGGMPGDLMQQLQSIANGQLSLQQQLNSEMMEQLAAEQQKLAEMLSNLGEKILEDKRLQQMLEKLAREMDDTAQMMHRNEERELIERKQLDIYRRLLDAKRSRREKDESEERKSWTAKEDISIGADRLASDLGEKEHELNERMKEAVSDDFDPEYIKLIRRYFESLLQEKTEVVK